MAKLNWCSVELNLWLQQEVIQLETILTLLDVTAFPQDGF